jgi:AcrR family transcriptional regulator
MSPARARTSRPAIIAAARDLLEEGGLEAVSMAGIAERVGIRAPSLYKHFGDRSGLIGAVATDVAVDLGRTLARAAERSGADPTARLEALAVAYRTFSLATPRAAALLFAGVAPGAEPTPESQAEAARPVLEVARAIVGPERALAAARVLTAFAHGFTSMESAGAFRFGGDVEEAYRLGISVLLAGLVRQ